MSNTWFPDPGYGTPDATPEELALEPVEAKAMRLLSVIREFGRQNESPLMAFKLDDKPFVMMPLAIWEGLFS